MEIILLGKTENLGDLGDIVKVKPGYARNYLIPKGKAVPATSKNRVAFEEKRIELEKQQTDILTHAQGRAEKINGFVLSIPAKAGDEGRLFGSVGAKEIAIAATATGIAIKKEEIRLSAGPLRRIGEEEITVHLHADVNATMTVNVVMEG
uniref:Large ribosomal subunit protein bL9 n=1 Tax=Candidatus Kentrum sp. MB TaxID=2138164 RepID=A0A450XD87_9GAMM|nr:MAG: LSU ribosomal protein L9P [Candidatus Kentron sp. MB]VFK27255.1 MAG: LSU ribosomal protein L9P [Candidatus Kentron sp. MB]VFK75113.1 MAG: LSU ribosomal protein L9P [Candidatus Kentron sp. MB]